MSNNYTSPSALIVSFEYEDSSTSYGNFGLLIILEDFTKSKSLDTN